MLDLLIQNARVVDGTGAPARSGDVGIRDGLIVEVGAPSAGVGRAITHWAPMGGTQFLAGLGGVSTEAGGAIWVSASTTSG